jgi:hypothetical protein
LQEIALPALQRVKKYFFLINAIHLTISVPLAIWIHSVVTTHLHISLASNNSIDMIISIQSHHPHHQSFQSHHPHHQSFQRIQ